MSLPRRDIKHIFQKLRDGLVPERGLDTFATGIEKDRAELHRQLELVADGEGLTKFLRGGYGCGKTFVSRLTVLDAQDRGFATSFVVVSDNDLHFHRFDDVYRKVISELSTSTCPRGALGDIIDRWIGKVEDALIDAGADEDAEDFDAKVRARIEEELLSRASGLPDDFVRVIQTIFELKQKGDLSNAGALLSWLGGSGNVAASAKRLAAVKGDITSKVAMSYLHGILVMTKMAGYKGMVIVIDEAETILRMRKDVRAKSMNGIRQICDMSGSYHGLLWMFTGTKEFFDSRRGVAGLEPLHDRIKFIENGGFSSRRQPQLNLSPFKEKRLYEVALKLRDMYVKSLRQTPPAPGGASTPEEWEAALERLTTLVSDEYIRMLVSFVTAGFKGDVGVVPRHFLRELIVTMDSVEEYPEYDPTEQLMAKGYKPDPRAAAEASGELPNDDEDDSLMAPEAVW